MSNQFLNTYKDFNQFVTIVSDKTGLSKGIIEKDYWVSRVLRQLSQSEFNDEIIFKGGTCLTKVWIRSFGRFSEDIDLLLYLKQDGLSKKKTRKAQNKRLKELIEYLSTLDEIEFDINNSASFDQGDNLIGGKFYFNYNGIYKETCPDCIKPKILIEPGYRGGIEPSSYKEINSIIGNYILNHFQHNIPEELKVFLYDINSFRLKTLNPERIFLEKLDAIRNSFKKGILKESTRHYYDLYMLLNLPEVKALKRDITLLKSIIEDISAISKTYYGLNTTLTLNDFTDCPAFYPYFEGFEEIKKQYTSEKGIYFEDQPDFELLIEKISKFITNIKSLKI